MNEIAKIDQEADYLHQAAMQDAGIQKMLKFVKGDYFCDQKEIPRGTQMIAHCIGWRKDWIKFWDRRVVERQIYRVNLGQRPPDVNQMPDRDPTKWQPGLDGDPADPWTLQYLLPMEDPETGEGRIFVTGSVGGKRAVSDLCDAYALRRKREGPQLGQPLIRLQTTMMAAGPYGNVKRPLFEIVSYDTGIGGEQIKDISPDALNKADVELNDEIPF